MSNGGDNPNSLYDAFGNFRVKRPEYGPPSGPGLSKHGYHTMTAISSGALHGGAYGYGAVRKRAKTEEEYFNDDEEASGAYQPAPGSPGPDGESDSEEDPLDAFMAGIEKQVEKEQKKTAVKHGKEATVDPKKEEDKRGVRQDLEEDNEESYYRYMEENPNAGRLADESDDDMEYDVEGNPIMNKKKVIDPLPPIDHSTITYPEFTKNFYEEHEDIASLTDEKVKDLREKLGISATGFAPPKPVSSFGHLSFDEALLKAIRKAEYTSPTPIQAQAVPIALSGRDCIGIAKTGSGKTAAFLWPALRHIMDQPELAPQDGPIALVLAPTRELAVQIYQEAKKFGRVYNINCVCAYGGGSKWEQSRALEGGAELVVGTPGRIIDLVKMGATSLNRVTYLVLDEADRMFDLGFEPQVRSICDHVQPLRQTLLFSATFPRRIERLARDVLTDPVRVVQGECGEANQDIEQSVEVFSHQDKKYSWLLRNIVQFTAAGSLLVFVTRKANAEDLAKNLQTKEFECQLLHGDMTQFERNQVLTCYKKAGGVLVATDVAARGLDIPHIRTVVNYDVARDVDTHTHRVGRTGRAGVKGKAVTLVTDRDKEFAGHLVRQLEAANQVVPRKLMDLACQSSWFRNSRFKSGKAKRIGGEGLGYRERPGLGSSSSSGSNSVALGPMSQVKQGGGKEETFGHSTTRLSALRSAFESQYKSQFTASTDDPNWVSTEEGAHYSKLKEEEARRKIQEEEDRKRSLEFLAQADENARRKRSRWE